MHGQVQKRNSLCVFDFASQDVPRHGLQWPSHFLRSHCPNTRFLRSFGLEHCRSLTLLQTEGTFESDIKVKMEARNKEVAEQLNRYLRIEAVNLPSHKELVAFWSRRQQPLACFEMATLKNALHTIEQAIRLPFMFLRLATASFVQK